MKNTTLKHNFTVSQDPKHQLFAGEIRNQVLREEFALQHLDFSHDEHDRDDNNFYLLSAGNCVGTCRVIARRDVGSLPLEEYLDLASAFGLSDERQLASSCEFSRLAILPEYQGASGASLLVNSVADYVLQQGLYNVLYTSTIDNLRIFSLISQRNDLWVEVNEQAFQYAEVPGLDFQAALVDMSRHFSGERRVAAKVA